MGKGYLKGLLLALLGLTTLLAAGAAQAAGPVYWDWPQGRDLSELEAQGLAVDWRGVLGRGLDHEVAGPTGPEVFWNLSADGQGGALVGSGHGGQVYHFDGRNKTRELAQLEGLEVFSTLALSDSETLVGCGPEGQVYRLGKSEKPELVGTVAGGYVWDMVRHDDRGPVWLATGSPAAIYRLGTDGKLEMVHELGAQNCLTLHFTSEGELLLGTQGPGMILRLDPQDPENLEVLFQAPQDEVRKIMTGPDGRLFFLALNSSDEQAAAEPKSGGSKNGGLPSSLISLLNSSQDEPIAASALYEITGQGRTVPYWLSDLDLMIAAWSPVHGWLAGGSLDQESGLATIYGLTPPGQHMALASWQGGDILDLLVLSAGQGEGTVLVAQAHPGGLSRIGRFASGQAAAISPVLDGGQTVDWGRLSWSGQDPEGKLRWSVRGGNSATVDQTWTDWTSTWSGGDHAIEVPASRFLQWQVQWPRSAGADFAVTKVSVSGWQDNIPPLIKRLELEKVSDISLGGMMNGSDNVTQIYRSGLKAEFSRNSRADRRPDPARAAVTRPVRVFSWQGKDPNGDRLLYTLEYQRQGDRGWRWIVEDTQETIGAWDTSEVPDGMYRVRLTADDALDNPAGKNLVSRLESSQILVDNSPPSIDGFKLKAVAGGFTVEFDAEDGASQLAEARVFLPDGSAQRLDPVDRICDSRQEKFQARINWPQPGKDYSAGSWQVRVEVRDLAGNAAVQQGDLDPESR